MDGSQKAQPEGSAECGAWSGRSWCDCCVQVNTTTHKGTSVPLPVPGLCPARPPWAPSPAWVKAAHPPAGVGCAGQAAPPRLCAVWRAPACGRLPVWHTTPLPQAGLRQCKGFHQLKCVCNNGLAAPGMVPSTEKGGAWLWQQSARECEAELSVQSSLSQGLQWPSEASVDGKQSCTKLQGKVSESDQSKPCPAQGCACLWLRTGVSAGTTGQWMWVFGCHTTEAVCLKGLC